MNDRIKLFSGIVIISWSSIIIRWMGATDPLIISFYRLILSAVIILPFVVRQLPRQQTRPLRLLPHILLAGFFLALHFFTWISSLQMTTVGNSIFLESTHPIFGLLLSVLFLKEKSSKLLIPALLLGLAGMYITVSADLHQDAHALSGDLLALLSAFCLAAYLLIARMLTKRILLWPYLFYVYGTAALFILAVLIFKGINFWELSWVVWGLLLILAVGPNLIGHSMLNWASRRMEIFKVNMALLSESIMATVYAAILLNEIPPAEFYFGSMLILGAITIVFYSERRNI